MKLKTFLYTILLVSIVSFTGCESSNDENSSQNKIDVGSIGDGNLTNIVKYFRDKNSVPALAVIMSDDLKTLEKASVGVKVYGENTLVTNSDKWHIGSITKSMTSTLSASLVEKGLISWNATIIDIFPELIESLPQKFHTISLEELLSHSSGIPPEDYPIWEDFLGSNLSPKEQRLAFLYSVDDGAEAKRGEYQYSNLNYLVAGAMLERVSGDTFPNLMQSNLFTPLGMNSSTIEELGDADGIWGHQYLSADWTPKKPVADDFIFSPAGSATFVTLDDMVLYLREHLLANQDKATLLTKESFDKLHTKVVDTPFENMGYSMGWIVNSEGLFHNGSNNKWYALSVINFKLNITFFIVTNSMDNDKSVKAVSDLADSLIKRVEAIKK